MFRVRTRRTALLIACIAIVLLMSGPRPNAQVTYERVADLATIGGSGPLGGVTLGADGAFYGTASSGGTGGCGLVYRMDSSGALTVFHRFSRLLGCSPIGELTVGPDGDFYGTTYWGGNTATLGTGNGTIYKISPAGVHSVLYHFPGGTGGAFPYAGLTVGTDGLLYGTTTGGSVLGGGVLYRISTTGVFEILAGGFISQAELTPGSDGLFYGTARPTTGNAGFVFTLGLNGSYSPFHLLPNSGVEGVDLLGELLEAPDGNFYGTTANGGPTPNDGGTIFRVTPSGVLTVLHAFSPDPGSTTYSQGTQPWAGLTLGSDGLLYGLAIAGGGGGNGVLYRLALDGSSFEVVRSFDGTDGGSSTEARLLEVSAGVFYGTTAGGKIFRLTVPLNVAPVAQNGSATTNEDTSLSGSLVATDSNSDPLTYSIIANGSLGNAAVTNPATGAFTYTPGQNATGVDTFTFKASDGTTDSNTATVTITISPVNDSPTALDGTVTTFEDTPVTTNLVATDIDSPSLAYAVLTGPTKGTAVLTNPATGAITYTPNPNASGTDTFTFEASDGAALSNVATVTVTITPVNDAPTALPGVVSTTEGIDGMGTLSATDADGGALTFSVATPPTQGLVTITDSSGGTFVYTPNAGAIGYDTFTFTVQDGGPTPSTASVAVFIVANSPRWPGQAVLASVSTTGAQSNGTNSQHSIDAAGHRIVFVSDATTLITGDTNNRQDVFLRDRDTGQTRRLSVSSAGAQANDSSFFPVISADGSAVVFTSSASNLAPSDTNGRVDAFVHDIATGTTTRVAAGNLDTVAASISANGRFVAVESLASDLVAGDGNGKRDIFVHDRQAGTTQRVSVSSAGLEASADSFRPVISADGRVVAFETTADNLVAGDANGLRDVFVHDRITRQTLRVSVGSGGIEANGPSFRPALSADGKWVAFTSSATNLVAGQFISNGGVYLHNRTSGATVQVSVTFNGTAGQGADYPQVSADGRFVAFWSAASNLVPGDTSNSVDVFVRDVQNALSTRISVSPSGGQVTEPVFNCCQPALSADGRFVAFDGVVDDYVTGDVNGQRDVIVIGGVSVAPTVQSQPAGGGSGSVSVSFAYPGTTWAATSSAAWLTITNQSSTNGNGAVTYAAAPNTGAARTATLTIALQTVTVTQDGNSAASAQDSSITTNEDTAASGVLAATDPDGNGLTFSLVANGTLGTAVITDASSGGFSYTPNANASGTDTFTFLVNDGGADSNVATVTVSITPVNDAPVALAGTASTVLSTPVTGTLQATDVDGPSRTFAIATNGTKGTAVITDAATGAYVYTPAAGQSGVDTFTFRVNDGDVNSNVATVTVTIAGNRPPTAANATETTDEDRALTGTLSGADPDGNPLTFSIVSGGSLGTVTVTNTAMGRFRYVPAANANGTDTFTFRVSDGVASSNVATVSVVIVPINDAPIAIDGAVSTAVNTAVSGVLAASDADGETPGFTLKGAPRRGTVVVNLNGTFTYTPKAGFVGTDSFTFRVSDGRATSAQATMTITVR